MLTIQVILGLVTKQDFLGKKNYYYLSVRVQRTTRKLYRPLVITAAHQATSIPIAAWINEWMSCWGWRIFPISASLEQGMEGTTAKRTHQCDFIICHTTSEDLNDSLSSLHKYSKGQEETQSQHKIQYRKILIKNSKLKQFEKRWNIRTHKIKKKQRIQRDEI